MTTVSVHRPPTMPAVRLAQKPRVFVVDETVDITSGSLLDWPDATMGTANWLLPMGYSRSLPDETGEHSFIVTDISSVDFAAAFGLTSNSSVIDYELLRLKAAAQSGNEQAFIAACQSVNWSRRPAEDFLQVTRWALAAGAHLAARNLASRGAQRYPDHSELRKYARILAPPTVLRRDLPPRPDLRANHDWLMQHGNTYHGKWVALWNGRLLASATSLEELTAQLADRDGVMLTRVF